MCHSFGERVDPGRSGSFRIVPEYIVGPAGLEARDVTEIAVPANGPLDGLS
jgi:hypothetical protein